MKSRSASRATTAILAAWFSLQVAIPTPVYAQVAGDVDPPVIRVDPLANVPADQRQVFTAEVSDNGSLASVTLHHRREGEQPFEALAMNALGSTDFFSVSLATDPDDLRPIEYYFEARDTADNRTVSGFAFDPYRRTVNARATVAPVPSRSESTSNGSGVRWWTVALGVLAVGALVAAAGSDDGGSGTAGPGIGEGVPLDIEIQEPR